MRFVIRSSTPSIELVLTIESASRHTGTRCSFLENVQPPDL